jgi:hypothetical protein
LYLSRCNNIVLIASYLLGHYLVGSGVRALRAMYRVTAQLEAFLPCIAHDGVGGGFDPEFLPTLGVDMFAENEWKVKGTVGAFGRKHPPGELGYVDRFKVGACTLICPDLSRNKQNVLHPTEGSKLLS